MKNIHSVTLFCGSADGKNIKYQQVAAEFGSQCAQKDITLYYGGAKLGLMRAAADAAMSHGGKVIGIVPTIFTHDVVVAENITELISVSSMSERKQTMERLSDAFVALPGAFGTMDELFEILTDAQLGLHHKPIVILNTLGYYDLLIQQLQKFEEEGFLRPFHRELLRVAQTVDDVFQLLEDYHYGNDAEWLKTHLKNN